MLMVEDNCSANKCNVMFWFGLFLHECLGIPIEFLFTGAGHGKNLADTLFGL
jgi:hypothetical protein